MSSEVPPPCRSGGEFFASPVGAAHRRYEALRAYFVEGLSAAQTGARFGYTTGTVATMVRDFRAGKRQFFVEGRPGPRTPSAKTAARDEVVRLRAKGYSIDRIAAALASSATPLKRDAVWRICRDEGWDRLHTHAPAASVGVEQRRAQPVTWPEHTVINETVHAGLFLLVPALVDLDLCGAVAAAGLPGASDVSAVAWVLSLLSLKMVGKRPSRSNDIAVDGGAALFAGLESLPDAHALASYSYQLARDRNYSSQLSRDRNQALLAALTKATKRTGQIEGRCFDLDFQAIRHFGDDLAFKSDLMPRGSQRTESVLTFFAHDSDTHNLVYANATCTEASRAGEVLAFARYWRDLSGVHPDMLVLDSKVATGATLAALNADGITFVALRAGNAKLTKTLEALPDDAWSIATTTGGGDGLHGPRQVYQTHVLVRGCSVPLRQLAVRGLIDRPMFLLTNDPTRKAAHIVDRYARRMTTQQRLGQQIRRFHVDALSNTVALNVDLDTTLSVAAQLAYDWLGRRLPGHETASPDVLWSRFISTTGSITLGPDEVVVRLAERAYSPVLRTAELPTVTVPWWGGRRLRFAFPSGKRT